MSKVGSADNPERIDPIPEGKPLELELTVKDYDTGDPKSLTGYTIEPVAWNKVSGATAEGTSSLSDASATDDKLSVTYAADALTRGYWGGQVWATSPAGRADILYAFEVEVIRDLRDEIA